MYAVNKKSILIFIFIIVEASPVMAQYFPLFGVPVYTNVSAQNNLLYGGDSNRVYLELSSIKADSISIVPYHKGTVVMRNSGNWLTIIPPPYEEIKKKTDQYDSLLQKYIDDPKWREDSVFVKYLKTVENYTVTERKSSYSTHLSIIALKRNGNKFERIENQKIPFEVIPPTYHVFCTLNRFANGESITLDQLLTYIDLRTQAFIDDQNKLNPPNHAETFSVVSFETVWDTEDGEIVAVPISGNQLSASAKSLLRQSIKPGATIIFENIKVKGNTSGQVKKVPSLIYYIK